MADERKSQDQFITWMKPDPFVSRRFAVLLGALIALFFACAQSQARGCSDVHPDATLASDEGITAYSVFPNYRPLPDVTPKTFNTKPGDCIVRFYSGTRGAAGQQEDLATCRAFGGTELLTFTPDMGSNVNSCMFRIAGNSAGSDDNKPANRTPTPDPTPSPTWNEPSPPVNQTPSQTKPPASPSTAEVKTIRFNICSKVGDPTVYVALIYRYRIDQPLLLRAWYQLSPNECHEIKLTRESLDPSALVYYYAESKRGTWNGEDEPIRTTRCVGSQATDRNLDEPYECKSSDRKLIFVGVRFKGNYTINLTRGGN